MGIKVEAQKRTKNPRKIEQNCEQLCFDPAVPAKERWCGGDQSTPSIAQNHLFGSSNFCPFKFNLTLQYLLSPTGALYVHIYIHPKQVLFTHARISLAHNHDVLHTHFDCWYLIVDKDSIKQLNQKSQSRPDALVATSSSKHFDCWYLIVDKDSIKQLNRKRPDASVAIVKPPSGFSSVLLLLLFYQKTDGNCILI